MTLCDIDSHQPQTTFFIFKLIKDEFETQQRHLNIRSTRDMLVMRILMALYGDDIADRVFATFKENRKSMKNTVLSEFDLYGSDEHAAPPSQDPNIQPISPESLNSLSADQMKSILSLILSFGNQSQPAPPVPSSNTNPAPSLFSASNPMFHHDGESDVATDPNIDSMRNRAEPKFRLEIALGRLQSYYSKTNKFSGDFEDDLEDALAEFDTACRGQLAPDDAKPELLRLAIRGRALTFYKSISAASLPWIVVQSKFRS